MVWNTFQFQTHFIPFRNPYPWSPSATPTLPRPAAERHDSMPRCPAHRGPWRAATMVQRRESMAHPTVLNEPWGFYMVFEGIIMVENRVWLSTNINNTIINNKTHMRDSQNWEPHDGWLITKNDWYWIVWETHHFTKPPYVRCTIIPGKQEMILKLQMVYLLTYAQVATINFRWIYVLISCNKLKNHGYVSGSFKPLMIKWNRTIIISYDWWQPCWINPDTSQQCMKPWCS